MWYIWGTGYLGTIVYGETPPGWTATTPEPLEIGVSYVVRLDGTRADFVINQDESGPMTITTTK
jgi:hypothetical protein